jgi:hypothetical protein
LNVVLAVNPVNSVPAAKSGNGFFDLRVIDGWPVVAAECFNAVSMGAGINALPGKNSFDGPGEKGVNGGARGLVRDDVIRLEFVQDGPERRMPDGPDGQCRAGAATPDLAECTECSG